MPEPSLEHGNLVLPLNGSQLIPEKEVQLEDAYSIPLLYSPMREGYVGEIN